MSRPHWATQQENRLYRLLGDQEIDEETFWEIKSQLKSDEDDWAYDYLTDLESSTT